MKRLVYLLSILLILSIFSSCTMDLVSIEDCTWKMRAIMSNNGDSLQNANDFVIVVGAPDPIHPDAEIIELTLTAKNGELILSDITNDKTYKGTYKVRQRTYGSIDYDITIDGISGYATVSQTKYYDGSEVPTLPINLGEYALYFSPNS